uniref:SFRICE_001930 n=1 Tax=Spodoptera frugiperda TaxID=7108 RepID=A0A2H1W2W8_SPOFR
MSAQWGVSRFGNPVLVIDGWRFRKNGKQFAGKTSWLCIKSDGGCKCYAVTSNDEIIAIGTPAPEAPPTLGLPFPFPCFPGQFRYCLSKRGKPAIEVGAHRFCFNGRAASGKVWWRCSRNPRCRAAVHTFGLRVVQMNSAHTCGVRATPLTPMF